MSIDIGIVGLSKSGKTTIFNALTRGKADTEKAAPHVGMVKVPEPRLEVLADMLHPKRVVPIEVRYIDIGASDRGLAKDKDSGGKWLEQFSSLTQLSSTDTLIYVVRAFHDESIPHVEGSLDIERDIATINLELTFSDLALLEKRLEGIEVSLKGAKPPERSRLFQEQELLMKIKADLEKDVPVRELTLAPEEARIIANCQLLTAKALLLLVNIGEGQLSQASSLEAGLSSQYSRPKCRIITLCGKLEMELTQLEQGVANGFRAEFGLVGSGLDRIIKLSYELLGLLSFFTIASGEVKAWTIQNGTDAAKAAGKIHSDMERGFIRAEVISYDDLVKCGSLAEARKKGLLRLEGKSYIVQDGDVITFLFNV
ncbi:redox-regulated ATPase YchF [Chloroflexota bacterium]